MPALEGLSVEIPPFQSGEERPPPYSGEEAPISTANPLEVPRVEHSPVYFGEVHSLRYSSEEQPLPYSREELPLHYS